VRRRSGWPHCYDATGMEQPPSRGLDLSMRGDSDPTTGLYAERRRAERRLDRRVLIPAFAASILLHLLLFRVALEPDSDRLLSPPPPRFIDVERVMRAFDITAVQADVPPIDVQIREMEQRRDVDIPDAPWTIPPAAVTAPPEAASVRERLRYRMGSVEVWRPREQPRGELMTPEEVVRSRVAAELQQFNDSVAAEAAAQARARDWTFTDSQGRRWGVTPNRIYINGDSVSIPAQIEFSPHPMVAREQRARIQDWTQIQMQAARVETQEVINERIRLIRERAEQERARNGGGATAQPRGG
jgi:hypothetical protein